jgi:type I restriction enzyme M protein
VAELEGQIAAATESADDEDEDGDDSEDGLSEEEIKELKRELSAAKRQLRTLQGQLVKRLVTARNQLDADAGRPMALDVLRGALTEQLERYVAARRARVVEVVEGWWDKYSTPLAEITRERDEAAGRLERMMEELAYV